MMPIPISRRQHGFSIVEIMVGVVIGMIAVLVIYQVFATSEGIKRNITARRRRAAERPFVVVHDGDRARQRRQRSRGRGAGSRHLHAAAGNATDSLRPIPVLITDGRRR